MTRDIKIPHPGSLPQVHDHTKYSRQLDGMFILHLCVTSIPTHKCVQLLMQFHNCFSKYTRIISITIGTTWRLHRHQHTDLVMWRCVHLPRASWAMSKRQPPSHSQRVVLTYPCPSLSLVVHLSPAPCGELIPYVDYHGVLGHYDNILVSYD